MNISKFIKKSFMIVSVGAVSVLSAETYYFDLAAYKNFSGGVLSLAESLTYFTSGASDFWYTQDDSGNKTYITSAFSLTDTSNSYVLGAKDSNLGPAKNLYVDSDFYGDTLTSGVLDFPLTTRGTDSVTMKFNTLKSNTYNGGFAGKKLNLEIVNIQKGKWNDGWLFGSANTNYNWAPLGSFKVTGTWNVTGSGGGIWSSLYVSGVENHSIDNPDAVINVLSGVGATGAPYSNVSFGTNNSTDKTSLINETSYVSINSVTSGAGFLVNGSTASTGKLNLVLSANVDSSTTGWLFEGYYQRYVDKKVDAQGNVTKEAIPESYTLKEGGAKLSLVMRSSVAREGGGYTYLNNTQSFTGNVITFTGGVEMISGKLLINYAPSTLGSTVSHGTLKLAQAEGATTSFGNSNASVGGSFIFDDIEVSGGGTIIVRLDKSGESIGFDGITLSSGGISYAAGSDGVVTIDFGTNTSEYLSDLIREDVSDGLKIISYGAGNSAEVEFSAVLKEFEKDGKTYEFRTSSESDGLYAAYVAVPEPSLIAMIMGIASLAILAIRKRK